MTDILYHWSPVSRRNQIETRGLVPGSLSVDKQWRPPHICLAVSPRLAWELSGMNYREDHPAWDLWEVWIHEQMGYEELYFDDGVRIKEVRVFDRIYKRNVWLVGTRLQKAKHRRMDDDTPPAVASAVHDLALNGW